MNCYNIKTRISELEAKKWMNRKWLASYESQLDSDRVKILELELKEIRQELRVLYPKMYAMQPELTGELTISKYEYTPEHDAAVRAFGMYD